MEERKIMSDALIIGILGLATGLGSIIVAFLKKPHETRSLDAQTVKTYAEAAKLEADRAADTALRMDARNLELYNRVSALEAERSVLRTERENLTVRVKSLEDERDELQKNREELMLRVAALEEENEILRKQLDDLHIEPAKVRKKKEPNP